METYDPKPLAASEYRGPFLPGRSTVPGLQLCELLPRQTRLAHRFALLRSLVHGGACHDSGPQQIPTGHPVPLGRPQPEIPDLLAVVHALHQDSSRPLPGVISIQPIAYVGSGFLGRAHQPFYVRGNPNSPDFSVSAMYMESPEEHERLKLRWRLRGSLDDVARTLDRAGGRLVMDAFQEQAFRVLTGNQARRAFDVHQEDPKLRDRYGRNQWGQQCLLARRLVEAGVELVTTTLDGPMCGRVENWDDHPVNHHIFNEMQRRAPYFDQGVATLIEDLHDRGMDREVLVVVGGDFGRTPRIFYDKDSVTKVTQPGRNHWCHANSFLFCGGGISGGQVVGATDRRGEYVVEGRCGVGDFAATIYHHLGIDATKTTLIRRDGRPHPLIAEGGVIPELAGG